jgi:hypothetical protein
VSGSRKNTCSRSWNYLSFDVFLDPGACVKVSNQVVERDPTGGSRTLWTNVQGLFIKTRTCLHHSIRSLVRTPVLNSLCVLDRFKLFLCVVTWNLGCVVGWEKVTDEPTINRHGGRQPTNRRSNRRSTDLDCIKIGSGVSNLSQPLLRYYFIHVS